MSFPNFTAYTAGPGDPLNAGNQITGSQPAGRVGEQILNCYTDSMRFADSFNKPKENLDSNHAPTFAEWATAQPGMVAVTSKSGSLTNKISATETAVPVVVCAHGLDESDDNMYTFAGIVRSPSVRDPSEKYLGPADDEFYTITIGGVMNIMNTGPATINAGDPVKWTFGKNDPGAKTSEVSYGQGYKARRIMVVKAATPWEPNVFGVAKRGAMKGKDFDVLVK